MIQIICDNCGKGLREKIDEAGAQPEKRVTLVMEIEDSRKRVIDMDLCVKCAQKYVGILKEPV